MPGERITKIVTFSGIDGAGKSTQIDALKSWLADAGLRVATLSFWDDVVAFPRAREFASRCAFRGDQGIGTPEKPLNRRDKNVSGWPLTLMRFCFYLADAMKLNLRVRKLQRAATQKHEKHEDVIIFDRYMYDELANLPLNKPMVRSFTRFLLRLIPKPDVAYVIDADPEAAWARKPEYPIEFLRKNRTAYIDLSSLVGEMIVIESRSVEEMQHTIREKLVSRTSQLPAGSGIARDTAIDLPLT